MPSSLEGGKWVKVTGSELLSAAVMVLLVEAHGRIGSHWATDGRQ